MIRTFVSGGARHTSVLRFIACLLGTFQTAVAQQPAAAPQAARQELIVVIGAPGTDEYRVTFESWAARWKVAAERSTADYTLIGAVDHAAADLEELTAALAAAMAVETTEPLWIVFIGHGTFDGRTASLNLNGPDISAQHLAEVLRPAKRPIAFIACASCSSPFINAFAMARRRCWKHGCSHHAALRSSMPPQEDWRLNMHCWMTTAIVKAHEPTSTNLIN
ncbi:MAG: hypothetical protein NTX48_12815 [Planctomycetales bacterium]|nr:hypothetical protein [Planctomycetales bacterium]